MANLPTIHYVTGHFRELQGLRALPLGLLGVSVAAWRMGWLLPQGAWALRSEVWFFVGLSAVGLITLALNRWYEERYGQVEPLPVNGEAKVFIGLLMAMTVGSSVHELLPGVVPVRVDAVIAATAFLWLAHCSGWRRRHFVVVAAGFLCLSLWDRAGLPPEHWLAARDFTWGLALLVGGIGDHLLLRQVLTPLDADEPQKAEAAVLANAPRPPV